MVEITFESSEVNMRGGGYLWGRTDRMSPGNNTICIPTMIRHRNKALQVASPFTTNDKKQNRDNRAATTTHSLNWRDFTSAHAKPRYLESERMNRQTYTEEP